MSPSLQQVLRRTYTHTVLLIIVEMLPRQEKWKHESMFYLSSSPFPNGFIRIGCNSNHRRAGGLSSLVYSFLHVCGRGWWDTEPILWRLCLCQSQKNGLDIFNILSLALHLETTQCYMFPGLQAPVWARFGFLNCLTVLSQFHPSLHTAEHRFTSQIKYCLTMFSPKDLKFTLLPKTVWPRSLHSIC